MLILILGAGGVESHVLARELGGSAGLSVATAGAEAALDEIAAHRPDAVLVDLDALPADPLPLVRLVRQHWPSLPLVIITGEPTAERAVAFMRSGATDFVSHPLSGASLLQLLRRGAGAPPWRDRLAVLRRVGVGAAAPAGDEPRAAPAGCHAGAQWQRPAGRAPGLAPAAEAVVVPLGLTLEEVERRYLAAVLQAFEDDYASLAARLGISRKTLWEKRRRLGLERTAGQRRARSERSA